MNYFVEGLQGSGKSTLVQRLEKKNPLCAAIREGDYSPVELAWCAYTDEAEYAKILAQYPELNEEIIRQTFPEGDKRIICYTKIKTPHREFYQHLEQYEIYKGRVSMADYKRVILSRYSAWRQDGMIFECSLFQNIVEEMMLFRCAPDEEIMDFYRRVRKALNHQAYRIVYLKAEDIAGNLAIIRRERADEKGNEIWFPLMLGFFNASPYAVKKGLRGREALLEHFMRRQNLELKILEEIFPEKYTLFPSKRYTDAEVEALGAIKQA